MPETEGVEDADREEEVQEAPEEKRLPSYTVTFTDAGIEVVCFSMNTVPLVQVERSQHLAFRQIMKERQVAARAPTPERTT